VQLEAHVRRACQRPLTDELLDNQVVLLHRAAQRPDGDPLWDANYISFCPGLMHLLMEK